MAETSPLSLIFEKAAKLNYPLNVVFELTHRCNLSCPHCYIPAPGKELGTDRVKTAINEVSQAGALFLTFTGGEVLLRRDFFDLAEHARSRKLALKVFTNATLIDDHIARRLAGLRPADVGVSLHGATAGLHDDFTGVPGSFDRAIAGIKSLRAQQIKVNIKLVITNNNWSAFPSIRALAEELGASFSFSFDISPTREGDPGPLKYRVDPAKLQYMLDDGYLYDGADRVPLAEGASEDFSTVALCSAGRDQIGIAPDGRVMPCIMLPIYVGDLSVSNFNQIWRGQELTDLRNQRLSDLHTCSTCAELRFCRRCSGVALLENNDMLGPSSWACQVAQVNRELDNNKRVGGESHIATL